MTFTDLAHELENMAGRAWQAVEAEAVTIVQEVEPVIESALASAVKQFGDLAVQTVISLMHGEQASLSGGEKLNLTVTTILDTAEKQAVTLAEADATALAKTAYLAVQSRNPGIVSTQAP